MQGVLHVARILCFLIKKLARKITIHVYQKFTDAVNKVTVPEFQATIDVKIVTDEKATSLLGFYHHRLMMMQQVTIELVLNLVK